MMSSTRKLKNDIIFILIKGLIFIIENLPRDLALKLAGVMGEIAAIVDFKERRLAEENLRRAFGEKWSDLKIKLVARECFVKIAKNAADVILSRKWSADDLRRLVDAEGMEHFDEAIGKGNGVLGLTGHIGNFELMAAWFSAVKSVSLSVIGRKLYDERLDELIVKNRERFGLENIPSDAPARRVYSVLKRGHMLGVLLDLESSKVSGHFVPFFGRPARTAAGPAIIARRTGSPVVPMAMYRSDEDRYLIKVLPSFMIPNTGDKEADVIEGLAQCNRALEKLINIDPTQWAWIHNRWKSKPSESENVKERMEEVKLPLDTPQEF